MNNRVRGMSRFELLVVLLLLLVLGTILLHRLREVQRAAERVAVIAVLDTLRAGLWLETAARANLQGDSGLARLAEEDPFPRLEGSVADYVGVLPDDISQLKRGRWYYDEKNRQILYWPRFSENFFTNDMTFGGVKFKIQVLYRELPGKGCIFEGFRITTECACDWLPKRYRVAGAGR